MSNFPNKLIDMDRRAKRLVQVLADIVLIVVSFWVAMLLRLESTSFTMNPFVWLALAPVLPFTILVFIRLGLYRSIVRYITMDAVQAIGLGVFVSAVLLFLSAQVLPAPIPRSVPGIYALLLLMFVGGVRFLMRRILRKPELSAPKRVVIYGAGESGRQLLNALSQGREFAPIAFVDDEKELQRSLIGGKRVFAPSELPSLIEDNKTVTILLAMPSASRARRREIVESLTPLGVEIKTIPGLEDIVSGRASYSDLKLVSPEDMLGRDPVPPRPELMSRNITGKVVLVSGAGGSIGSELCRQIINHDPAALVLLEVSEYALYAISTELRETLQEQGRCVPIEPVLGSVQNPGRVRAIFRSFRVQTVYHAAAYKHVVMVEENVVEGIRNNVFGTQVMVEAAAELGVENFILISTDKAVRPTNFMGASKRMAELVCQAVAQQNHSTIVSMVRFGNVLGSSGSVIPRFRAQIESGGPLTVTHRDITRYFMTIPEASQLVIQAGAMGKGGDVFVLDMGKPIRILDLAQNMIKLHGLKPYIMEMTDRPEPVRGDIGIKIVGLNKGEKLYEELLVGDNPSGTEHPRIMCATELSLNPSELNAYLNRLQRACYAFDIATVREIFLEAPLAYQPSSDVVHDLMWVSSGRAPGPKLLVLT